MSPYFPSREELPPGLKSVLPEDAQELYREAFNQAWGEYDSHLKDGTREQNSHRAGWSAVRRRYNGIGLGR